MSGGSCDRTPILYPVGAEFIQASKRRGKTPCSIAPRRGIGRRVEINVAKNQAYLVFPFIETADVSEQVADVGVDCCKVIEFLVELVVSFDGNPGLIILPRRQFCCDRWDGLLNGERSGRRYLRTNGQVTRAACEGFFLQRIRLEGQFSVVQGHFCVEVTLSRLQ